MEAAKECRTHIQGVGVERGDIDRGQRPGFHPDDEFPTFPRIGWQAFASTPMEEAFFNTVISPRLGPTGQALVRSHRGPTASIPFFTAPVYVLTRFDLQCFVLRLVSICSAFGCCSCVAFGASFPCRLQLAGVASHLTPRGHHRGACGVLGRRGFPLESRQGLQRSRCQSLPEHRGSGSGPSALAKGGQQSLGSGGRRPPAFPRRSLGDRHHDGQRCPSRWCSKEGSVLGVTELRWTRRGEPKKSGTWSSLATRIVWWCSLARQAGGGLRCHFGSSLSGSKS